MPGTGEVLRHAPREGEADAGRGAAAAQGEAWLGHGEEGDGQALPAVRQ